MGLNNKNHLFRSKMPKSDNRGLRKIINILKCDGGEEFSRQKKDTTIQELLALVKKNNILKALRKEETKFLSNF